MFEGWAQQRGRTPCTGRGGGRARLAHLLGASLPAPPPFAYRPLTPNERPSSSAVDPEADMVLVPEGEFRMGMGGYTDTAPHKVWVDAFWIDRRPVTNRRYQRFVVATHSPRPPTSDNPRFNGD